MFKCGAVHQAKPLFHLLPIVFYIFGDPTSGFEILFHVHRNAKVEVGEINIAMLRRYRTIELLLKYGNFIDSFFLTVCRDVSETRNFSADIRPLILVFRLNAQHVLIR